ncbi:NADH-quinone oxidoreductase subunit L [Candidatus Magnetominusculus dajiuhuensis]|uniref:NADH-quinone oxidoreductase subunit L n=1 Tax=Candidatus Magnetominusculus dajiuhuensis TaxID=3137712 RepID=UPI003B42AAFB
MDIRCYILIPLLPLLAFVLNIVLGKALIKRRAHLVATAAVAVSLFLSVRAFIEASSGTVINQDLYTWIVSGTFKVSAGFLIDQLTAIMLIVVTSVSFLVHVYSIGYMHGDDGYPRFFSFLSLFTFSMLMLVMSNNFLQLYFGWEAVGLCSYFLIGFWYEKKSAADAAKKAFIVNRFGDFGFGLGVILIFLNFGSLHYADVFKNLGVIASATVMICGLEVNLPTLIALLLFCGAVGKSAQLPLHVWLPDAMEGPTPVSALIHAATMVTAGVFLVARANPIFTLSPVAMNVVAITGGLTAIFAATIALVQNDIKRVVAYSTVSQLGYMFVACGVGAFSAGIFHLYTHAFFKACLFLCAGSVMHAMGGELDVQKMGGLKKFMPVTYWTMLIASLSIAGIPGLSGFFSKDEILWKALSSGSPVGKFVWIIGVVTALLTAFYSFRILFLAFHGTFRGTEEQKHHLHESPSSMTIPLVVLSVGAIVAGYAGVPHILGGHDWIAGFLGKVTGLVSAEHVEGAIHSPAEGEMSHEWLAMAVSVVVAVFGVASAAFFYLKRPELPKKIATTFAPVYKLLFNKYYVDEFYGLIIVRPCYWVSENILDRVTDKMFIEGIVNGVPALVQWSGQKLRRIQTGVVLHYALVMAVGVFLLAVLVLLGTGPAK